MKIRSLRAFSVIQSERGKKLEKKYEEPPNLKTYLHFNVDNTDSCSKIGGSALLMLAIESLASKQANTTVFFMELG